MRSGAALLGVTSAVLTLPAASAAAASASYTVRLTRMAPPEFVVSAAWPAGASRLEMDTTRPGDLPALLEGGWPALVVRLHAFDHKGASVEVAADGARGWRLALPHDGPLWAEYVIDTAALAAAAWPAPREAVHVEDGFVSIVGRALFVTTDRMQDSTVTFELPEGLRAHAPWPAEAGARPGVMFRASSVGRLRANLIACSARPPVLAESARLHASVFPLGHWSAVEPEVARVVRAHARRFGKLMELAHDERYVAVLLPVRDGGAESYPQSLALTSAEAPTLANQAHWANLLGHEMFHLWNGWLLRGADYASSQWFQEGFTEYAANVSTAAAGAMSSEQLVTKLAAHVAAYRRLATTLADPGTSKGPPLYSAGALVAFGWDVAIRQTSGGSRDLGHFLRALLRRCGGGVQPYTRADIVAALQETAAGDWDAFYDAHIEGRAPLPLQTTFTAAGLRLNEAPDGAVSAAEDPAAAGAARRIWRAIASGR